MEEGFGRYPSKEKEISPSAQDKNIHEHGIDENDSDQLPCRSGFLTSFSWGVLCSSLLLAEMQAALDTTMTANLQPSIINTFGESESFPGSMSPTPWAWVVRVYCGTPSPIHIRDDVTTHL